MFRSTFWGVGVPAICWCQWEFQQESIFNFHLPLYCGSCATQCGGACAIHDPVNHCAVSGGWTAGCASHGDAHAHIARARTIGTQSERIAYNWHTIHVYLLL